MARPMRIPTSFFRFTLAASVILLLASPAQAFITDPAGSTTGASGLGLVELTATPWSVTDLTCAGEYALTTQVTTSGHLVVIFPVYVGWKETVRVDEWIDYELDCEASFETTVTGSGGVLRRVGVEYPKTVANSDPVLGYQVVKETTEDEEACHYDAFGCSQTYGSGGKPAYHESNLRVKERPGEMCFTPADPELDGLVAYNRPDHPDPIQVTSAPSVPIEVADPEEVCKKVNWTKVESIDAELLVAI